MNDREWGIQDRLINRAYNKCEEEKKRKSQGRHEVVRGKSFREKLQKQHVTVGPTWSVRTAF